MPRLRLDLSYEGTQFRGWQRQAEGIRTVQQVLEDTLTKITSYKRPIIGCGRTDAGVHASGFVAHVDLPEVKDELGLQLNATLPDDVRIHTTRVVDASFHAQRCAISRRYRYLIATEREVGDLTRIGGYGHLELDAALMAAGVELIRRTKDFRSFCRQPAQYPSTACELLSCTLRPMATAPVLSFEITANRFLKNMVRLLVARLIDLGRGSLKLSEFAAALQAQQPLIYQRPAYANGLTLTKVTYPSTHNFA